MKEVTAETIAQFNAFIKSARNLLPSCKTNTDAIPEFSSFIEKAKPIVVQSIREILQAHRDLLKTITRWLVPESSDILAVAGLSGAEDPYTKLIAWMLWPEGRPDLALCLQKAWIEALGLPEIAMQLKKAVEPQPQFKTQDGRPDMVMHFQQPAFVLIVEAKTGTEEHETPESDSQTQAYADAVLKTLKLPEDYNKKMVFLTRDGMEAADPNAINTTYGVLVTAIAGNLSRDQIDEDLRWAYSIVLTHFLTHAVGDGTVQTSAMRLLKNFELDPGALSDEQILKNLGILGPLCRALQQGNRK